MPMFGEAKDPYRAVFDAARDAMIVYTPEGVIVEANAAACGVYGYAREELIGADARQAIHPDARPHFEEFLRVAGGGGDFRCETVDRRRDGTAFPIEVTGTHFTYGGRQHLMSVIRDISDRKRADEALRASGERLRRMVNIEGVGVLTFEAATGTLIDANDWFLKMSGFTREEVAARELTWKTMTPPEHVAESLRQMDLLAATGRIGPYEKEYFRKDGSKSWMLFAGAGVGDGTVVEYCIDISDRKRAEAARRASEDRLRLTADAIPALIAYVDARSRYQFVNAAYRDWFGVGPDEVVGRPVREIVGDAVYAERLPQIERALSGERVRFQNPMPHARLGRRETETTYEPDVADDGTVRGFVVLVYDMTERTAAERERERLLASEQAARAEAERAGRMKDEFLSTLSHELRTPLNAILGWSQILAAGSKVPADLDEGLRTIERNARAQTRIIEDLLDLSGIISGKVRLVVQRTDLASVVEAAVETVRPAAEAKGLRLQAVLDPQARPVSGDPNRLQQVFWNLLTNAVKFTPRGGRVQVLLERVDSHLEVSVIDTGEGIRPEFLPHVFDRFRQADGGTTRRHGGLGIGLSIVKQLVELHGGSVRVRSGGEGAGAAFTVSLPLTEIHPPPDPADQRRRRDSHPEAATGTNPCPRLAGVKVLVVDDEPDARALIKRLLEECDAKVQTAGSVAEAMKLVESERPDVLISDIGMPGEDGYSLIRRVRALTTGNAGKLPALALTAYARSEDRVRALAAGYQMHVAKPVEPAELIMMVASLAGRTGQPS